MSKYPDDMTQWKIIYDAPTGAHLQHVATSAVMLASKKNSFVSFRFNGLVVYAGPNEGAASVMTRYENKRLYELSREVLRSPPPEEVPFDELESIRARLLVIEDALILRKVPSKPDNERPCRCGSWHFPYCKTDPRDKGEEPSE